MDREFAAAASPEVVGLMKLHDELILQNALHPSQWLTHTPIFNGTALKLRRILEEGQKLHKTAETSKPLFGTPYDVPPPEEIQA